MTNRTDKHPSLDGETRDFWRTGWALYVSSPMTEAIKQVPQQRRLYCRARAVVDFDRVLTDTMRTRPEILENRK